MLMGVCLMYVCFGHAYFWQAKIYLCWLALYQLDTNYSHLRGGNLIWEKYFHKIGLQARL